jgi:hypothetical protein
MADYFRRGVTEFNTGRKIRRVERVTRMGSMQNDIHITF